MTGQKSISGQKSIFFSVTRELRIQPQLSGAKVHTICFVLCYIVSIILNTNDDEGHSTEEKEDVLF